MNILIKNYPKDADAAQLSVIIDLLTTTFKDELKQKGKLLFDDKRLKNKLLVELQPNGNLSINYKIENIK